MNGKNPIVEQLRGVASKVTSDAELQKDLMQEMFVHLVDMQTNRPGMGLSWYIKSCEFHARNYLRLGRSIDSHKRSKHGMALERGDGNRAGEISHPSHAVDTSDLQSELISKEIVDLITPHLTERQQQILSLLTKGLGVRETARELGITHPAVIKHRRKIARVARTLLQTHQGATPASGSASAPVTSKVVAKC